MRWNIIDPAVTIKYIIQLKAIYIYSFIYINTPRNKQ